jgi:hypothetical protein
MDKIQVFALNTRRENEGDLRISDKSHEIIKCLEFREIQTNSPKPKWSNNTILAGTLNRICFHGTAK